MTDGILPVTEAFFDIKRTVLQHLVKEFRRLEHGLAFPASDHDPDIGRTFLKRLFGPVSGIRFQKRDHIVFF